MPSLEKSSWIAGIVSAVLAAVGIAWGVWSYIRPPETSSLPVSPTTWVTGNQNLVVHGGSNTINLASPALAQMQPNPELLIAKVNTGITRKSIEALFGQPRFDDPIPSLGGRNLIFVFPRFFLQVVVSLEEKVAFYSVTTRTVEFRPEVPKLDGRLMETKLADFGDLQHVYSDITSKYYEYAEKIYLGNAGNYRTIYLGFCPSGAPPDWGKFKPAVLNQDGLAAVNRFRAQNAPNCYGVGDILGEEDAIVRQVRIGLDYYVARDLPPE